MADIEKLNQSIERAVQSLLDLKKTLNTEFQETPIQAQATPEPTDSLDSFDSLERAVHSNKWPAAVNPNLICDPKSESDQVERARGIIELMIEEDLKDKKFLDYGCGPGYVARLAKDYQPKSTVGFDLQHNNWDNVDGVVFTNDFSIVQHHGPYDVILLFDVLDHLKAEPPVAVLKKARDLLSDTGKIYMRCHPFTSRHATHLYNTLNKAYLHLVFTDEELKRLVPEPLNPEHNIGVVYPIKTYGEFIEQAGLKILSRRDLTEKVENFFKIPKIAERIMDNTKFASFPDFQMSLQFIDFVLGK